MLGNNQVSCRSSKPPTAPLGAFGVARWCHSEVIPSAPRHHWISSAPRRSQEASTADCQGQGGRVACITNTAQEKEEEQQGAEPRQGTPQPAVRRTSPRSSAGICGSERAVGAAMRSLRADPTTLRLNEKMNQHAALLAAQRSPSSTSSAPSGCRAARGPGAPRSTSQEPAVPRIPTVRSLDGRSESEMCRSAGARPAGAPTEALVGRAPSWDLLQAALSTATNATTRSEETSRRCPQPRRPSSGPAAAGHQRWRGRHCRGAHILRSASAGVSSSSRPPCAQSPSRRPLLGEAKSRREVKSSPCADPQPTATARPRDGEGSETRGHEGRSATFKDDEAETRRKAEAGSRVCEDLHKKGPSSLESVADEIFGVQARAAEIEAKQMQGKLKSLEKRASHSGDQAVAKADLNVEDMKSELLRARKEKDRERRLREAGERKLAEERKTKKEKDQYFLEALLTLADENARHQEEECRKKQQQVLEALLTIGEENAKALECERQRVERQRSQAQRLQEEKEKECSLRLSEKLHLEEERTSKAVGRPGVNERRTDVKEERVNGLNEEEGQRAREDRDYELKRTTEQTEAGCDFKETAERTSGAGKDSTSGKERQLREDLLKKLLAERAEQETNAKAHEIERSKMKQEMEDMRKENANASEIRNRREKELQEQWQTAEDKAKQHEERFKLMQKALEQSNEETEKVSALVAIARRGAEMEMQMEQGTSDGLERGDTKEKGEVDDEGRERAKTTENVGPSGETFKREHKLELEERDLTDSVCEDSSCRTGAGGTSDASGSWFEELESEGGGQNDIAQNAWRVRPGSLLGPRGRCLWVPAVFGRPLEGL